MYKSDIKKFNRSERRNRSMANSTTQNVHMCGYGNKKGDEINVTM